MREREREREPRSVRIPMKGKKVFNRRNVLRIIIILWRIHINIYKKYYIVVRLSRR